MNSELKTNSKSIRRPHILLAVTGCAQAEVIPRLVSNMIHHPDIGDHEVIVAATPAALQFFERSDVEKIVNRKIFVQHSDATDEFPVPHINLVEWAEAVIVYPASANTIAKCVNGFSDTLVANIVLAAQCPVYFGPTMNKRMYDNPVTQYNIRMLQKHGYCLIPQEMCQVVVRATGQVEEKMFCSEAMVLHVCDQLFHHRVLEAVLPS